MRLATQALRGGTSPGSAQAPAARGGRQVDCFPILRRRSRYDWTPSSPLRMSIASFAVPTPPPCLSSPRRATASSSTRAQPRRSDCPFLRLFWWVPKSSA